MNLPEGWPNELVEFIKSKAHHLPVEDQHALSVMLAAPTQPAQDDKLRKAAEEAIAEYGSSIHTHEFHVSMNNLRTALKTE